MEIFPVKKLLLLLPLLLIVSACVPEEDHNMHGYMEGEYVMISPTSGGILKILSVERGQEIKVGQDLFSLDMTYLEASKNSASAALERAQAQLDDLKKGSRPEELEIINQQLEQAEISLSYAKREYERLKPLADRGAESKSKLDAAKTEYDNALSKINELKANLAVSKLASRDDQIKAASAVVKEAEQAVIKAENLISEASPKSPAEGVVDDTYYRVGEYVAAGKPVISILPPENIKARFFVPQAKLPEMKIGSKVKVGCDGCKAPVSATINYISSEAEYTPPVIYSVESREKMVFMVEAKPDVFDPGLRPGLPVDIITETP